MPRWMVIEVILKDNRGGKGVDLMPLTAPSGAGAWLATSSLAFSPLILTPLREETLGFYG